ncbi:hypothetical protein [Ruminococcus flavefaciens]|uniref:Uncharacterized protein n=1 Tax=Ruminococcus flavefaciens 007c TaxID=1341157 RepID=W7UHJ4_RUMFL|nr:hypothetical protein [Ruminococcus flavefaciens]EWM53448.1 hypothetical protein RF007C_07125 [Ruminococcus flavefaciens 007c]
MSKRIIASFVGTAVMSLLCALPLSAHATTADDVAAVARAYGYSEEDIQTGYNEYYSHPEDYPSERLDKAIEKLHEAGNMIITAGPQVTETPTTTTTAAPSVNEGSEPVADDSITITASDGTTFTRISKEAFIKMSYDEKMAYVRSFTPAQQQALIDNLSPEEYRSLMKQSPADQKLQIVGTLSDAAKEMGLNISVDEVSDDTLTLAVRNDNGELVNVSTAGASVEDTGYDRRGILAAAGALISLSIGAVYILMRRFRAEGSEN